MAEAKEIARINVKKFVRSVAWSAQGDRLAVGRHDGRVSLLVWDGGAGLALQRDFAAQETGTTRDIRSLCFDPSGQRLLFNTSPNGDAAGLIDLSTDGVQRFQTPITNGDSAFSPDGSQLAFHFNTKLMIGPADDLARRTGNWARRSQARLRRMTGAAPETEDQAVPDR
jgi:WD40 repeat protein